jgi:hypothetical protein
MHVLIWIIILVIGVIITRIIYRNDDIIYDFQSECIGYTVIGTIVLIIATIGALISGSIYWYSAGFIIASICCIVGAITTAKNDDYEYAWRQFGVVGLCTYIIVLLLIGSFEPNIDIEFISITLTGLGFIASGVISGLITRHNFKIEEQREIEEKQAREIAEQNRIQQQREREQKQHEMEQKKKELENRIVLYFKSSYNVLEKAYKELTENPYEISIVDIKEVLKREIDEIYRLTIIELHKRNFNDAEIGLKILCTLEPQNQQYADALNGLEDNMQKLKLTAVERGLAEDSSYLQGVVV